MVAQASVPLSVAMEDIKSKALVVPDAANSPVRVIDEYSVRILGQNIHARFQQFKSDRQLAELRWLRNQRQYLGVYDPEVDRELQVNRSRSYPKLTRVKCISILSRLMSLMFQANQKNWKLDAAPWPSMSLVDVQAAVAKAQKRDTASGGQPQQITQEYVMAAVKTECEARAKELSTLIEDQFQELGGHQAMDYTALNRKVLGSGIVYGLGVLRGPFVRPTKALWWDLSNEMPIPKQIDAMTPMFEFCPVWDFYPDMTAKTFTNMDGYFIRKVVSRSQLKDLSKREDFMKEAINQYLNMYPNGNWRPEWYESELRAMGVKANVNDVKPESTKYQIIIYHGPVTGNMLQLSGAEVPEDKLNEEIDAEIWMLDGIVIKADVNQWRALDVDMPMIHTFCYDEDDTSPVGFGVPVAIRDSQMGVSAATRMMMDNASVVCGPNIEVNMDLMRPDQDLQSVQAYKVWYREGDDITAQWNAVRNIDINAHIDELLKIVDFFMRMADMETFVGPATGGDMSKVSGEPFRSASGAAQLRGDAALPFKDMVRAFDSFTQSVVQAMVNFNRKFNPKLAPNASYNVVALGASSLMEKEIKGQMADDLSKTMTPDEKLYFDMRKLATLRASTRDMDEILVGDEEAARREAQQAQTAAMSQDQQTKLFEANLRKILSDAFKNIAGAQKTTAQADATSVESALLVLETGINNNAIEGNTAASQSGDDAIGQEPPSGGQPGGDGDGGDDQIADPSQGGAAGTTGPGPASGIPGNPG